MSGETHEPNRTEERIVNGVTTRDNNEIAQAFNHHFASLSKPPSNVKESPLLPHRSLFDTPEITSIDVERIVQQIPISKATGPDRVSVTLMKAGAKAIAPSLAKLLNLCFSTASFPQIWKTVEVVPLFKGGDLKVEI